MTQEEHDGILAFARRKAREEGIDKTLKENDVDVIIGPADGPLYVLSGAAGEAAHNYMTCVREMTWPVRISRCNTSALSPRPQRTAFRAGCSNQGTPRGSVAKGAKCLGGNVPKETAATDVLWWKPVTALVSEPH